MPAKKADKNPNVCATIYEGRFDTNFDCPGVEVCKFALCQEMPPTGDEECCFREYGSCRRPVAQHAALDELRKKITRELKKLDGE